MVTIQIHYSNFCARNQSRASPDDRCATQPRGAVWLPMQVRARALCGARTPHRLRHASQSASLWLSGTRVYIRAYFIHFLPVAL